MRGDIEDLIDNMFLCIKSGIENPNEPTLVELLLGLLRHGIESEPYLVGQKGWSGLRHIVSVIDNRRPLHSKWLAPTIEEIIEIVLRNPKLLELGTNQIRARSGHSIRGIRVGDDKDRCIDLGNDNQAELLSKAVLRFVLKILRHSAEDYSIILDRYGWASVDDLILLVNYRFQINSYWKDWNRAAVETICDLHSDRLEMRNGTVRARYGHSVSHVQAAGIGVPPRSLFHGTSSIALPWILQSGLQPAGRNYVHLTSNMQYALSIGETTTAPAKAVVLEIDTIVSRKLGISFHRANNHVWLAVGLPPSVFTLAQDNVFSNQS
jgi:putative RNA 2'-phosphotransferase